MPGRRRLRLLQPLLPLLAAVTAATGCTGHGRGPERAPADSPPSTVSRIDGTAFRPPPGRPLLLSFLDPRTPASRNQLAVLRSMATQYGPSGLTVAVTDATGRHGHDDLVNLHHDWRLDAVGVQLLDPADPVALADSYGVTSTPTTLLVADGKVARRWTATVAPAQDLALRLQALAPSPSAS